MRRADWLARLWCEIGDADRRPFAWGEQDCCKFAARCVEAMTGVPVDLPYSDKTSALRYLAEQGGIEAAVTARYGPPLRWWQIQRGDLCLVDTPDGVGSLGVSLGPTVACVHEEFGVIYVPIDRAMNCWRIE